MHTVASLLQQPGEEANMSRNAVFSNGDFWTMASFRQDILPEQVIQSCMAVSTPETISEGLLLKKFWMGIYTPTGHASIPIYNT